MKLTATNGLHEEESPERAESENEELNSNAGLDLPFMMLPHPLLPVSLPPASVAMVMHQMNHFNTISNMAAAAQRQSPLSRAGASVIKETDSSSPATSPEQSGGPEGQDASGCSQSQLEDPPKVFADDGEKELPDQGNGSNPKKLQKENVLSLSQELFIEHKVLWGTKRSIRQGTCPQDAYSQVWEARQTGEMQIAIPVMKPNLDKGQLAGQLVAPGFSTPFIFADSLSSVETLLTNIQFLLKVALDSARVQERQMQEEKKELRMELYREREMRETLERQLAVELQSRATVQRRLKKEKKAKRKLQEVLEFESKRREQMEQALRQATGGDSVLSILRGFGFSERDLEGIGTESDSAEMQENINPTTMY
ncbi:dachshund homolog 2-like [Monodelphis domestica]|uniref:dachshund homolog 2-like n=1 Tax=Monodelphis domestica TaxID=13616 RepID=UPI0024E1BE8A|nr:dachshund homolog 2-like [Monodelphis domestica]